MKAIAIVLAIFSWSAVARAKRFRMPKTTRQLVLVTTASWTATDGKLVRFQRTGAGPWKKVGEPVAITVGKSGLGWGYGLHGDDVPMDRQGPLKSEGDGRAPAGIFKLSALWGYAEKPPAGATLPYTQSTAETFCVDDPRSKLYNTVAVATPGEKQWKSAEPMKRADNLYALAIVVDHNQAPIVAGQGSCVFLHAHAGATPEPTTGCTAMAGADLETLATWLSADAQPILIQLPKPELEHFTPEWKLPTP